MKLEPLATVASKKPYGARFAGPGALVVQCDQAPQTVLDATTGAELGSLPSLAGVGVVAPSGEQAVVTLDGKDVGGRYEWSIEIFDTSPFRSQATLWRCHPEDKLSPIVGGAGQIVAIRATGRGDARRYAVCRFAWSGELLEQFPLADDTPMPFLAALSPDERVLAHGYFTGVTHLVALDTKETRKLAGGALRIGRQHDLSVKTLAFNAAGSHLMSLSPGKETVFVWSMKTRKAAPGAWSAASAEDAFFVGDVLAVTCESGSALRTFGMDGNARATLRPEGSGGTFVSLDDGRSVAWVARTGWVMGRATGKAIEVFDVESGTRTAEMKLPSAFKGVIGLSARKDRLAVVDQRAGVGLFAVG